HRALRSDEDRTTNACEIRFERRRAVCYLYFGKDMPDLDHGQPHTHVAFRGRTRWRGRRREGEADRRLPALGISDDLRIGGFDAHVVDHDRNLRIVRPDLDCDLSKARPRTQLADHQHAVAVDVIHRDLLRAETSRAQRAESLDLDAA